MAQLATPFPRLNQRLEVAVGDRGAAQYFSKLVEETADTLTISQPEMEGRVVDVDVLDPLRLWYTRDGGYWCLHTKVVNIFDRDGERLLQLERQDSVKRAQRRNHVRVNVALLMHANVDQRADGSEAGGDVRTTGTKFSAVTRDVSGGGISFRTTHKLEAGDRINATFYLPEHGGDIGGRARVVHVRTDPDKPEGYIVACTFDRMAIAERERIIRFLFFRQRELAGKRKVVVR